MSLKSKTKKSYPKKSRGTIKATSSWRRDIALILLSVLLATLLNQSIPRLIDVITKEHPNTTIYQYVTSEGPHIILENRGEAIDKVRVTIEIFNDSIEQIVTSNSVGINLISGGLGEKDAEFLIDELWPGFPEFIHLKTTSNIKTVANVRGFSKNTEGIEEEIPTILIENQ